MSSGRIQNKIAVWTLIIVLLVTMTPAMSFAIAEQQDDSEAVIAGESEAGSPVQSYIDESIIIGFSDPGVTPMADGDVCEIEGVGYATLDDALATLYYDDSATIKLLSDINYSERLYISGMDITLDLNGFKLNVVNTSGTGLEIQGGQVLLLDPENGELNVSGTNYGAQIYGKAEVTSATATAANSSSTYGVSVSGSDSEITVYGNVSASNSSTGSVYGVSGSGSDSEITVYGNVSASNSSTGSVYGVSGSGSDSEITVYGNVSASNSSTGSVYGVYASNGGSKTTVHGDVSIAIGYSGYGSGIYAYGSGSEIIINGDVVVSGSGSDQWNTHGIRASGGAEVIIDGAITVPSGKTYIEIENSRKAEDGYRLPSAKAGYKEYSDGTSTVWVAGTGTALFEVGSFQYASLNEVLSTIPDGGSGTIKLLSNVTHNEGVYISNKEIVFDMNGYILSVVSNAEDFGSLYVDDGGIVRTLKPARGAFNITGYYGVLVQGSGTVDIAGDVNAQGQYSRGVSAWGEDCDVTIAGNITSNGVSVDASDGAIINITGNVDGKSTGVAVYEGGEINVTGDVKSSGTGVQVSSGGDATINGNVTVIDTSSGAYTQGAAIWGSGMITIIGNVISTGGNASYAVSASGEDSIINVLGNVFATATRPGSQASGVSASYEGKANVSGNVAATALNYCSGVEAGNEGEVFIGGGVTANASGSGSWGSGAVAYYAGEVTIDGTISVSGGAKYINVGFGNSTRTPSQFVTPTTKAGYRTYTDKESTVWVGNKPGPVAPAITTAFLASGAVGKAYTARLSGVGTEPISWSISEGSLPAGLSIDSATGVISGTPGEPGVYAFAVRASNAGGNASKAFSITIGITIDVEVIDGIPAPADRATPVTEITETAQYTGKVRWSPKHAPFDFGTTYTAIIELTPKGEYTFIGVPANFFTIAGASYVTNSAGSGIILATFPATGSKSETSLSINPSHIVLTPDTPTAPLVCNFKQAVGDENHNKLEWSIEGDPEGIVSFSSDRGKETEITASLPGLDSLSAPKTIRVKAEYDGRYVTTTSVELLPYEAGAPVVTALETKVGVNKAKTGGTLVPIQISQLSHQSIQSVKLYRSGEEVGSDELEAFINDSDNRWIEIKAYDKAVKSYTGVTIALVAGGMEYRTTNTINITVTATWPKITLRASQLNLFLTGDETEFTATAADGSEVTVSRVEYFNNAASGIVAIQADNKSIRANTITKKTGTAYMNVMVDLTGYYKATKNGNVIKTSIKVVNTKPKLKLGRTSVPLTASGSSVVEIGLLSGDKKVPFELNYTVADVVYGDTNGARNANVGIDYDPGLKVIKVTSTPDTGSLQAGTAILKVTFNESPETVLLKLKVSVVALAGLKASAKPNTLAVHAGHVGHIADVPVTINAANLVLNNWAVQNVDGVPFASSQLNGVIDVAFVGNTIKLSVENDANLTKLLGNKNANKKYKLNIGSDSVRDSKGKIKIFPVTLTVTAKAPTFKVGLKGKIDIANPGSALNATATLTNTTSGIKSVTLYNQNIVSKKVQPPVTPNYDFEVYDVDGRTFKIRAAGRDVVPGTTTKLSVRIELENGQTLNSWTTAGKDSPITIKPAQTTGKTWRSKSAVTLYKANPLTGEAIGLKLTTPANVQLGKVEINAASVKAFRDEGFELKRSGENDWILYYKKGTIPELVNGKKLGSSYTVKLELWAVGTYGLDSSGKAVALQAGKAKSKPAMVSIKVNIK